MEYIEWSEKFESGISTIDDEHRMLVRKINKLYSEIPREPSNDKLSSWLAELKDNISSHFISEERQMIDLEYPNYESHKKEHDALISELSLMISKCENNVYFERKWILSNNLGAWFSVHFLSSDTHFHDFLDQSPVNPQPK